MHPTTSLGIEIKAVLLIKIGPIEQIVHARIGNACAVVDMDGIVMKEQPAGLGLGQQLVSLIT